MKNQIEILDLKNKITEIKKNSTDNLNSRMEMLEQISDIEDNDRNC